MIDMKRKWMKIIVALCMMFCLLLVGCGQKTAGNAQDAKNGVAQIFCTVRDENGTLVAGGSGSGFFVGEMNKNPEGIETNIVGENAVDRIDARKATAMLKLKMRKR